MTYTTSTWVAPAVVNLFLTSSWLVRSTMCCRTLGLRRQIVLGTKRIGMEDGVRTGIATELVCERIPCRKGVRCPRLLYADLEQQSVVQTWPRETQPRFYLDIRRLVLMGASWRAIGFADGGTVVYDGKWSNWNPVLLY